MDVGNAAEHAAIGEEQVVIYCYNNYNELITIFERLVNKCVNLFQSCK